MVRKTVIKDVPKMKIDVETFIEKYNKNEAILLDIRYPFETKVWGVKFAKEIPYNELPDRLSELPKDKVLVCACPIEYRASMAKEYLRFKGYNAKTLNGGLLALMERLKGGKAKDVNLS
ncbi:MAG: rhodanese-like domain-containing protein [Epsilonproteobacteria bacterium]|nr:rhodanese-like domain-containing protein [Campylobacterota bacterium]